MTPTRKQIDAIARDIVCTEKRMTKADWMKRAKEAERSALIYLVLFVLAILAHFALWFS